MYLVKTVNEMRYLKNDNEFYNVCSENSKKLYREHYDLKLWKKKMDTKLRDLN